MTGLVGRTATGWVAVWNAVERKHETDPASKVTGEIVSTRTDSNHLHVYILTDDGGLHERRWDYILVHVPVGDGPYR